MTDVNESPDEALDGLIEVNRADQAYALLRQGRSHSDIADDLNYASADAVRASLDYRFNQQAHKITSLEREAIMSLEWDRLEELLHGSYVSAQMGDPKSAAIALKIIEMEIKLMKLDQPEAGANQNTVLVIGGLEKDYVEKLKEISSG